MSLSQTQQHRVSAVIDKILSEDPLTMVVRAHLYIESALMALIREGLEHPEHFEVEKLNFPQKIQLCIALGFVSHAEERALNKLNKIRNRFVHNLEASLSKRDARDLFTYLQEADRERVRAQLTRLGAGRGHYLELVGMVFIVLYAKYEALLKGLETMRGQGLSREEMLKHLREIS